MLSDTTSHIDKLILSEKMIGGAQLYETPAARIFREESSEQHKRR
jgi:hypothetical protein